MSHRLGEVPIVLPRRYTEGTDRLRRLRYAACRVTRTRNICRVPPTEPVTAQQPSVGKVITADHTALPPKPTTPTCRVTARSGGATASIRFPVTVSRPVGPRRASPFGPA